MGFAFQLSHLALQQIRLHQKPYLRRPTPAAQNRLILPTNGKAYSGHALPSLLLAMLGSIN